MKTGICIICLMISLTLTGCQQEATLIEKPEEEIFQGSFTDATGQSFQLIAGCKDQQEFDYMRSVLEGKVSYLTEIFSTEKDGVIGDSFKAVNDQAGVERVTLPKISIEFLRQCKLYTSEMGSVIQITDGSVVNYWDEWLDAIMNGHEPFSLPSIAVLQERRKLVDDEKLTLGQTTQSAFLSAQGMSLDLEGHALAYTIDECCRYLKKLGFKNFQIRSGLMAKGVGKSSTDCWHLPLVDPTPEKKLSGLDGLLDTLCLQHQSGVMIGSFEQYIQEDGNRYHRLVSLDSLEPQNNYLAVVVVDSKNLLHGEMLAESLYMLPIEDGKHLAQLSESAEAMWIHYDGRIEVTEGFTPFMQRRGQTHP